MRSGLPSGARWRGGGGARTLSESAQDLLRAFEKHHDMSGFRDWYAWLASRTALRDGQLVWGQAQCEHEADTIEYEGIAIPRSLLDRLSAAELQAIGHLHCQWERDGVPRNDFVSCYEDWLEQRHLAPFAPRVFR